MSTPSEKRKVVAPKNLIVFVLLYSLEQRSSTGVRDAP